MSAGRVGDGRGSGHPPAGRAGRREGVVDIGTTAASKPKAKQDAGAVAARFFEKSPDPFLVLDGDGVIVAANDAFRALVPDAGPGTNFLEAHGDPARVRMQMALLSTSGGETVAVEAPPAKEGQSGRRVDYRFFPLDGDRLGAIGQVREPSALGASLAEARRAVGTDSAVPAVDPLTGLATREHLLDRLAAEWCRSEQSDDPLSCLVLRVDGLERVSREEGTDVAEALFKATAGRIKTLLREHDAVGRYGDDRFLILAHRCEADGARLLGQRIAREIAMTRFAVRGGLHRASIRFGCGSRGSGVGESPESLLLAAEQELQG